MRPCRGRVGYHSYKSRCRESVAFAGWVGIVAQMPGGRGHGRVRFGTAYARRARPFCFHAFHASRAAKMSATQPNAAAGKMMTAQITAGADIGFVLPFN